MSNLSIEDLDEIISNSESSLVQLLALQLRSHLKFSHVDVSRFSPYGVDMMGCSNGAYVKYEDYLSVKESLDTDSHIQDYLQDQINYHKEIAKSTLIQLRNNKTVTSEHRRTIKMLLKVCAAAFELADNTCQQKVDGEDSYVVPKESFEKLSQTLDEIEQTLPDQYEDLQNIILTWSAIPGAALLDILQTGEKE